MNYSLRRDETEWQPPLEATTRVRDLEVGMVLARWWGAWEVTHIAPMAEPDDAGYDTRCTLRRLHGPPSEHENSRREVARRYSARRTAYIWRVYTDGRVWLCSCCNDPAPCRQQVAQQVARQEAALFEKRLARMGTGICYACGEVITQRQDSVRFRGDHADFPGRPAPRFHTRRQCAGERWSYARRAGTDMDGNPLDGPPAEQSVLGEGDPS
ncbi:hypothetical protein [Nocardioides alkalitolerans]|uniref:hypothetical protein n=1 Tax=Nocardioides alkalitolerans TaxID=281714 RepID=UPI00041F0BAF|nr:hypothetical protein [Nocardioides alkalitolerans]